MELCDAIKTAHSAVMDAELPAGFQEVAFAQVLRHVLTESSQPSSERPEWKTLPRADSNMAGVDRLAAKVGASTSVLADLFEITVDSVSLHVASSRIATSRSRATREIALLVNAARQGSGVDEAWTQVEHVREALQNYKRYDTNNFSAYLKGVKDAFNFRGRGISMEMRLTQPGWELATNLIASLTGGSS
jgi:hypothetical protein